MNKRGLLACSLGLTLLAMVGCGDDTDSEAMVEPATFELVRDEVLVPGCSAVGCHLDSTQVFNVTSATTEADFLDFASYTDATMGTKLVVPGDATNSLLVQRISGVGARMPPPPSAPLSAEDIARVQSWVNSL